MKYIFITLALLAVSCNNKTEDAHAHNPDGSHVGEEIPRVDYTLWTDKTELFVEFPALIVGNPSRFAAHFTILDGHQPVREGSVTVSLIKDGEGIRNTAEAPSSPGIFSPTLQPKEAGTHKLVFELTTPGYSDKIILNDIRVFANFEEATKVLGPAGEDEGISFLKEQAWKIEFGTAPVTRGKIFDMVSTYGVWLASPGTYKAVVASANGMVDFAVPNLTEGMAVEKGQLLMTLGSEGLADNNLRTEIQKARANFEQAKAEYERKKELYEAKIVPEAEFEQVKSRFLVAQSNYQTLASGVGSGGKQIRAPFDGFVKSINVSNGAYVEQGTELVAIGTDKSRLLKTQISPSQNPTIASVQDIFYQTKENEWSSVKESGGSILSVGKEVGAKKPMVPIYAKINKAIEAPEGSYVNVQIALGQPRTSILVPVSALLEDYGNYSVIVQMGGETFERRPVKIGNRNGKKVEVLEGPNPGEMVVTKGAYQVKMASMSGTTPAHGHKH